jgi:hypothetical protein
MKRFPRTSYQGRGREDGREGGSDGEGAHRSHLLREAAGIPPVQLIPGRPWCSELGCLRVDPARLFHKLRAACPYYAGVPSCS